jgi:hypothetical protein
MNGRRSIALLIVLAACSPPTSSPSNAPATATPTPVGNPFTASPQTSATRAQSTPTPAASLAPITDHRIGVRDVNGSAEFYDRLTGVKFVPRGTALWRWKHWPPGDQQNVIDTIFNTQNGQLDSALAELPEIQADGFNVVRLWFNACWGGALGCLDLPQGGLDRGFLENMATFTRAAKDHGIYVILTMDSLPDLGGYQAMLDPYRADFAGFNLEFMSRGGVAAQSKYQTDLIQGLMDVGAPMDAILAFQPKEEAYFEENLAPLFAHSGNVTAANGRTYDLADARQRRALMEDSWVYYIEQVSGAIKAIDPTALVTMGYFVQHEPNPVLVGDPRLVYMDKVLNESVLDFVSFSAYPGFDLNMRETAENFDIIGYEKKPLVMGEFGAERSNYPDEATAAAILQAWQVASCEFGFDGWQLWTWDGGGDVHDIFWEGVEGSGAIRRALSPRLNPDPCSAGAAITDYPNIAFGKLTKSSGVAGPLYRGTQAIDLSVNTQWNAGGGPPAWIQIDLEQPFALAAIRLVVAQEPEGPTVHRVLGRSEGGDFHLLHELRGTTRDGQVVEYAPAEPMSSIRYIRIETTASPSWVAWREIEVMSATFAPATPATTSFAGTWVGTDPVGS